MNKIIAAINQECKTDREKFHALFRIMGDENDIKVNENSINFEGKRYEFGEGSGDLLRIVE